MVELTVQVMITPQAQLESGLLFLWDSRRYAQSAYFLASKYIEYPAAIVEVEAWISVYRPAANLYCHSIELSLKAYLLSKGEKLNVLSRKPFSHYIDHGLQRSLEAGLTLSDHTQNTVRGLNADYSKMRFRYAVPGKTTIWPAGSFDKAAKELIDAVEPSVSQTARNLGIKQEP